MYIYMIFVPYVIGFVFHQNEVEQYLNEINIKQQKLNQIRLKPKPLNMLIQEA